MIDKEKVRRITGRIVAFLKRSEFTEAETEALIKDLQLLVKVTKAIRAKQ